MIAKEELDIACKELNNLQQDLNNKWADNYAPYLTEKESASAAAQGVEESEASAEAEEESETEAELQLNVGIGGEQGSLINLDMENLRGQPKGEQPVYYVEPQDVCKKVTCCSRDQYID